MVQALRSEITPGLVPKLLTRSASTLEYSRPRFSAVISCPGRWKQRCSEHETLPWQHLCLAKGRLDANLLLRLAASRPGTSEKALSDRVKGQCAFGTRGKHGDVSKSLRLRRAAKRPGRAWRRFAYSEAQPRRCASCCTEAERLSHLMFISGVCALYEALRVLGCFSSGSYSATRKGCCMKS